MSTSRATNSCRIRSLDMRRMIATAAGNNHEHAGSTNGRYWARTSDLRLVESAKRENYAGLSVRSPVFSGVFGLRLRLDVVLFANVCGKFVGSHVGNPTNATGRRLRQPERAGTQPTTTENRSVGARLRFSTKAAKALLTPRHARRSETASKRSSKRSSTSGTTTWGLGSSSQRGLLATPNVEPAVRYLRHIHVGCAQQL
jgi:hypothetical protein